MDMNRILWIIFLFFFASALYIFALFGLPLFGIYTGFPFFRDLGNNPYSPWNPGFIINSAPFVGIFLSYSVFLIYSIIATYFSNHRFTKKFLQIYVPFEFWHRLSLLISMPFLFPFGFSMIALILFNADLQFGPMQIVFGACLWIVWFVYYKNIFSRLLGIMAVILALWGVVIMFTETIPEFRPNVYGQFPLNDKKGVYQINYDGDYWLTYYVQEQYCINQNTKKGTLEKVCKINLVKKGNTAIVESPVELKKYLDKPVQIQGSFVKIMPPVPPENIYRQFCITKPTKSCVSSKGPGTWYFSPLKITSIQ